MAMPVTPSTPITTIYIVDDDAPFLRSVARLLRAVGYAVETFLSAQEFLDRLNSGMCGCVVSDLQMPGMNTFSATQFSMM